MLQYVPAKHGTEYAVNIGASLCYYPLVDLSNWQGRLYKDRLATQNQYFYPFSLILLQKLVKFNLAGTLLNWLVKHLMRSR